MAEKGIALNRRVLKTTSPARRLIANRYVPGSGLLVRAEDKMVDKGLEKAQRKLSGIEAIQSGVPISVEQLRGIKVDSLKLTGEWENFLGKISADAIIMAKGIFGGGKSSFGMKFADMLDRLDKKVLFITGEEGIPTLQEKVDRFKLRNNGNIEFAYFYDEEKIDLNNYDLVVFDSVTAMKMNYEDVLNLLYVNLKKREKRFPNTVFLLIYQMNTQGGNYDGNKHPHLADIVINFNAGLAKTEKNRFNQTGEMQVY